MTIAGYTTHQCLGHAKQSNVLSRAWRGPARPFLMSTCQPTETLNAPRYGRCWCRVSDSRIARIRRPASVGEPRGKIWRLQLMWPQ